MIFDIFNFVGREDSGNGHILKNLKFAASCPNRAKGIKGFGLKALSFELWTLDPAFSFI